MVDVVTEYKCRVCKRGFPSYGEASAHEQITVTGVKLLSGEIYGLNTFRETVSHDYSENNSSSNPLNYFIAVALSDSEVNKHHQLEHEVLFCEITPEGAILYPKSLDSLIYHIPKEQPGEFEAMLIELDEQEYELVLWVFKDTMIQDGSPYSKKNLETTLFDLLTSKNYDYELTFSKGTLKPYPNPVRNEMGIGSSLVFQATSDNIQVYRHEALPRGRSPVTYMSSK